MKIARYGAPDGTAARRSIRRRFDAAVAGTELKLATAAGDLAQVLQHLAQVLQRFPTTAELAARLGVTPSAVLQARRVAIACRPVSIQQPMPGCNDLYLVDLLPVTDDGIETLDNGETLRVPLP